MFPFQTRRKKKREKVKIDEKVETMKKNQNKQRMMYGLSDIRKLTSEIEEIHNKNQTKFEKKCTQLYKVFF